MSGKVNTAALGAFIVGAIVLLVALVLWFSGANFGADRQRYLMVFDGSLKGLRIGAPVALKGVDIGQVVDIDVVIHADTFDVLMPVTVEIDSSRVREVGGASDEPRVDKLIERGLRAQLRTQSLLTGLLYIQLDFHPDTVASYPKIESDYPQVPTIPTDLAELARVLSTVDVGRLISQSRETLDAVNRLLTSERTQGLPARLDETLAAVTEVSRELDSTAVAVKGLAGNVDGAVTDVRAGVPEIMAGLRAAVANVETASGELAKVLRELDYQMTDDSSVVFEVVQAAQELARAGRALQVLVETIDARPEVLLRGKPGEEGE